PALWPLGANHRNGSHLVQVSRGTNVQTRGDPPGLVWRTHAGSRRFENRVASPSGLPTISRMPHPDVAAERAHLRFAQEWLDRMRGRTAQRIAGEEVLAANEADAEAVKYQLQQRLKSLDDSAGALCFGRIDETDGDRWYVGRRHVEDGTGAPVIVDWRAAV